MLTSRSVHADCSCHVYELLVLKRDVVCSVPFLLCFTELLACLDCHCSSHAKQLAPVTRTFDYAAMMYSLWSMSVF